MIDPLIDPSDQPLTSESPPSDSLANGVRANDQTNNDQTNDQINHESLTSDSSAVYLSQNPSNNPSQSDRSTNDRSPISRVVDDRVTEDNIRNDRPFDDLNTPDRTPPSPDTSDVEAKGRSNQTPQPARPSSPKKSGHEQDEEPENFWVELRNIFVLSVALAIGLKIFVAESRFIPSESMLPTLEVDDRLIVEKMSYRFHNPKRGDVVVFRPTECAVDILPRVEGEALIKRIVGLPGETVEVRQGKVYINGKLLVESYVDEAPIYTMEPKLIPEDSYLVLGDNRNNSYDGHVWGFLPRDQFIGRAALRIWPLDRLGSLNEEPLFHFDEAKTVTVPENPETEFSQCVEDAAQ